MISGVGQVPDDPSFWYAVGSAVAGALGIRGYDKVRDNLGGNSGKDRAEAARDKELIAAVRQVSETIASDGERTRTALYSTSEKTQTGLQEIAQAQAKLEGRLSRNGG